MGVTRHEEALDVWESRTCPRALAWLLEMIPVADRSGINDPFHAAARIELHIECGLPVIPPADWPDCRHVGCVLSDMIFWIDILSAAGAHEAAFDTAYKWNLIARRVNMPLVEQSYMSILTERTALRMDRALGLDRAAGRPHTH